MKLLQSFNLILIFTLLISCASAQNITKNIAIELAENYIAQQGYTNQKIDLNKTKIDSDILDQYRTPEKIAELRHNLLESKAVFSKEDENGWLIGFEYKIAESDSTLNIAKEGKGVLVFKNGQKIQMFHENILFE